MGICVNNRTRRVITLKLDEQFEKRYPCSYNEKQLIEKIKAFIAINENDIQQSFYKANTNDEIFEILKREEKQILINYFNPKKDIFINDVKIKINSLKEIINDFNELAQNIINVENGQQAYKNKIIREVERINNNKNSFKIDFCQLC